MPHAELLFTQRLRSVTWRVRQWARHDLTLVGRCKVAKQVLASCFTYHSQFLPAPPRGDASHPQPHHRLGAGNRPSRGFSRHLWAGGCSAGVGGRVLCLSLRPSLCQGRASLWRLAFDLRDSAAGSRRLQRPQWFALVVASPPGRALVAFWHVGHVHAWHLVAQPLVRAAIVCILTPDTRCRARVGWLYVYFVFQSDPVTSPEASRQ